MRVGGFAVAIDELWCAEKVTYTIYGYCCIIFTILPFWKPAHCIAYVFWSVGCFWCLGYISLEIPFIEFSSFLHSKIPTQLNIAWLTAFSRIRICSSEFLIHSSYTQ